jgi:hypothetical protein
VVVNAGGSANPSGFRVVLRGTAAPAIPPDVTPPTIIGATDRTIEAQGAPVDVTPASLGITATDDVDGAVAVTLSPGSVSGLGSHVVTATASDAAGNAATATFTISLVDTVTPAITSLGVTLTPVSGRFRCISSVQAVVNAVVTDANDPAPSVRIVSVESADEVRTCGWHRFAPDWTITGDLTVDFRANFFSRWFGRNYVITVEASDASGNTSTATIDVVVGGGVQEWKESKESKEPKESKEWKESKESGHHG